MDTVLEAGDLWKAMYHHSNRFVDTDSRKRNNNDATRLTQEENQSYAWETEPNDLVVVPSLRFPVTTLGMFEA